MHILTTIYYRQRGKSIPGFFLIEWEALAQGYWFCWYAPTQGSQYYSCIWAMKSGSGCHLLQRMGTVAVNWGTSGACPLRGRSRAAPVLPAQLSPLQQLAQPLLPPLPPRLQTLVVTPQHGRKGILQVKMGRNKPLYSKYS